MSDFKITNDKIDYICSQLGISSEADKRMVNDLHRDFQYFYDYYVRTQYLAPIVMAMERYIQKICKKERFRIIIMPMRSCNARGGVAFLRENEQRYEISVPPGMDVVTTRNIVAHELGHLFYVINCQYVDGDPTLAKDGRLADKMADVLGIFTVLERTDFYKNRSAKVCRNTYKDVVYDFVKQGRGKRYPKNPLNGTAR